MSMRYNIARTQCALRSHNPKPMRPTRLFSRHLSRPAHPPTFSLAARRNLTTPAKPRPFPTVSSCPAATCGCAAAPTMPEGFEIDFKKPLNGSMPAYDAQVLLSTGQEDWPSKIEEMDGGENVVSGLKKLIGRGGEYFDPYHNIVPLATSFVPSPPPEQTPTSTSTSTQSTSAYILPNFTYIPHLPNTASALKTLVTTHLLPSSSRDVSSTSTLASQPINEVLVLICGHGGRDIRCGVLGPILEAEFKTKLEAAGYEILSSPPSPSPSTTSSSGATARVGLISHIGGHKFAGNIIIYVPPGQLSSTGEKHALAGKGIWYGRVLPEHVEGIVAETIAGGRVIEEMFRGGVVSGEKGTQILRL